MLAVVGEALIDLVIAADGSVLARPGGGPFNVARTLARLGQPATFVGRLADDGFGDQLRDYLRRDDVTLGVAEPSAAPTTLAVASIDEAGAASYRFYLGGTSAADLDYQELRAALPPGMTALHVGTLGLVAEPIATGTQRLITHDLPGSVLLMLDPNCRPAAIHDPDAYRRRLLRIVGRADIVKVSAEDLAYLLPDQPASALLDHGARLVLVTDGPRPATAIWAGGSITADVPAVRVVDTIGAGDAFGGGFLASWTRAGYSRHELDQPGPVAAALRAAVRVAALTCTRRGADPPRLADLQGCG